MPPLQGRPALSITVLGSGTCTPSARRGPAAYLVRAGAGRYLMDCGSGTVQRLAHIGVLVHDLDAIFLTHLHLDHSGDLFNILFSLRNSGGLKREGDVRIFGPPGLIPHYEHLRALYGRWVECEDYAIVPQELGGDEQAVRFGALTVAAHRVRHSAVAVGYRFTLKDEIGPRSLAFTGDADEGADLHALLAGVDLALMDCSTLDESKIPGHMSAGIAGRVARDAAPGRVVLTHFYPGLSGDPSPAVRQVRGLSGRPTEAAWDGAVYDVDPVGAAAPSDPTPGGEG